MSPGPTLLQTPMHSRHQAAGARMGDQAGWDMPLSYRGPLEEAAEVRRRAGVFDLSHWGRIRIRGDGALNLLERLCTTDVAHQEDDTSVRTVLCNVRGGIMDVCRLVRLEDFWLLLTSPECRVKILDHLHVFAEAMGAKVDDQTEKTCQIAVVGPAAGATLDPVLPIRASDLPDGAARMGAFLVAKYIALRLGQGAYWSLHVVLPNLLAGKAWEFITSKAGAGAIAPAGQGAWDILRLEAGEVRYGREVNESIDPVTAGLEECLFLQKEFIGVDAIRDFRMRGTSRKTIGLLLDAPVAGALELAIPRQGSPVYRMDGSECGAITSATFSPTLGAVVALAHTAGDVADVGRPLLVYNGQSRQGAKVAARPFC